ncbi:MAG TPA: hypothetical protein GXX46_07300 [Peptococcaceae bacterium]|nr:hypothetical protein [Peptococcaceae bacterium]
MFSWKEEDVLTGFLFIALLCHGMFFAREWLILGTAFMVAFGYYRLKEYREWKESSDSLELDDFQKIDYKKFYQIFLKEYELQPVIILGLMVVLSLAGLLQPVRWVEGYLEAFRWLTFLAAYLWGRRLVAKPGLRAKLVHRIKGAALIVILLAWLPGSECIWAWPGPTAHGRFALSFGYPNAAAAFLGCLLLMFLAAKEINLVYLIIFGVSFVSTGSRAALILLAGCFFLLGLKRLILRQSEPVNTVSTPSLLGFYKTAVWIHHRQGEDLRSVSLLGKIIILIFLVFFVQQTIGRSQGAFQHLLTWTDSSLAERMLYYLDSFKIAWYGHFFPQAGGWLAFPLIQTAPYWTLDPHSSFCRILLNQGLLGVILLGFWAGKGLLGYLKELRRSRDLTAVGLKTTVVFLGLHSLFDVDLSFGLLGILFWLLVGLIK